MLITEFFSKAVKSTVFELENGLVYLSPFWETYLKDEGLKVEDVSDMEMTREKILEMLKLEVERRNRNTDRTREIIDWIADIIKTDISTMLTQEENIIAKNILEDIRNKYMQ